MNHDDLWQKMRRRWFWKARWHVLGLAVLGAGAAIVPFAPLDRFSFDMTSVWSRAHAPLDLVIVEIDDVTKTLLQLPRGQILPRRYHAQAVRCLQREGARVIVFDLVFEDPSVDAAEDQELGRAMHEHGAVVLGADVVATDEAAFSTVTIIRPIDVLLTNAAELGSVAVVTDNDRGVRRHMVNPEPLPSIGAQAARLLGHQPPVDYLMGSVRPPERFLKWYRPDSLRRIDFSELIATNQMMNLRGATVIIGSKTSPKAPGEKSDTFQSPYSYVSGPTIHAVVVGNYFSGEWLRQTPWPFRALAGALWGAASMLAAWRWNRRRPVFVWMVPVIFVPLAAVSAVVLLARFNFWFPWMLAGIGLPPLAAFWLRWRPTPQPLDVFISYRSAADGETAKLLYNELNRRGIVAFYAPVTMRPGPFPQEIERSVCRASCFVLVLSERTFAGNLNRETDWVLFEIQTACKAGKNYIPLLKEAFQLNPGIWPPELGVPAGWKMLTHAEYDGRGNISPAAETIANLVRNLDNDKPEDDSRRQKVLNADEQHE